MANFARLESEDSQRFVNDDIEFFLGRAMPNPFRRLACPG